MALVRRDAITDVVVHEDDVETLLKISTAVYNMVLTLTITSVNGGVKAVFSTHNITTCETFNHDMNVYEITDRRAIDIVMMCRDRHNKAWRMAIKRMTNDAQSFLDFHRQILARDAREGTLQLEYKPRRAPRSQRQLMGKMLSPGK